LTGSVLGFVIFYMSKTRMSLLILLACLGAMAESVTLTWLPNAEPDIAGYNIYTGVSSGTYTNRMNLPGLATTARVDGLVRGVNYFFACTAYNTQGGESDYSSEYEYLIPYLPPRIQGVQLGDAGLNITFESEPGGRYRVFWSGDIATGRWENLDVDVTATGVSTTILLSYPSGDVRFYRVVRM
jgi:hypothetical protein